MEHPEALGVPVTRWNNGILEGLCSMGAGALDLKTGPGRMVPLGSALWAGSRWRRRRLKERLDGLDGVRYTIGVGQGQKPSWSMPLIKSLMFQETITTDLRMRLPESGRCIHHAANRV